MGTPAVAPAGRQWFAEASSVALSALGVVLGAVLSVFLGCEAVTFLPAKRPSQLAACAVFGLYLCGHLSGYVFLLKELRRLSRAAAIPDTNRLIVMDMYLGEARVVFTRTKALLLRTLVISQLVVVAHAAAHHGRLGIGHWAVIGVFAVIVTSSHLMLARALERALS